MASPSACSSSAIGLVWLWLWLTAVPGLFWWWSAGQPVNLSAVPSAHIACVSYAPYWRPGQNPLDLHTFISPARIHADLRALSHRFDCVRIYSQSQGLAAVPAIAQRYGMKVLMGIWLGRDARVNTREIVLGLANARNYPEVLSAVIVGNEVLLRGELSPRGLAAYIRQVRAAVPATVPVSYADVWENWLRYRQMAKVVDELTVHILPYWEDQPVAVGDAVHHVAAVYAKMRRVFPGKPVIIGETGWPSQGRPRRGAIPGLVNEARYLREFIAYADMMKVPYNVIEAYDQPWKRTLEGTVGGYWGILNENAKPKFPMRGPVIEVPYWWLGFLAALGVMILFCLAGCWQRSWHGWRGWLALILIGLGSGSALAWQGRQMYYACITVGQWTLSLVGSGLALGVALSLAHVVAARLAGAFAVATPRSGWRFICLSGLVFYSLLEVFDGRYRQYPLGLFALPCIGYVALVGVRREVVMPSPEQRFLAVTAFVLGLVMVVQERARNPHAWLWLGLCFAMAITVLVEWHRARG